MSGRSAKALRAILSGRRLTRAQYRQFKRAWRRMQQRQRAHDRGLGEKILRLAREARA